jgi:hypothetical protein
MLEANAQINLCLTFAVPVRRGADPGPIMMKKTYPHDQHSQPGVAVFRPDLHRLRLWQVQGSAGSGFGMDELLSALCFAARAAVGIMSKTPFEELNNPPFLIATTFGTMSAFVLAMSAGRIIGRLSF